MYAVVGCSECSALWIVEGRPETTECPRCGQRRPHAKRRKFVETADESKARDARAAMLAARQDQEDAFDSLASFAEMDEFLDEAGVSDGTYLEGAGLDPEAVAAAGERAERGAGGGTSRVETVCEALASLDEPTEAAVIEYAAERGVDGERARETLDKLVRSGEVTENRGRFRLV